MCIVMAVWARAGEKILPVVQAVVGGKDNNDQEGDVRSLTTVGTVRFVRFVGTVKPIKPVRTDDSTNSIYSERINGFSC